MMIAAIIMIGGRRGYGMVNDGSGRQPLDLSLPLSLYIYIYLYIAR